MERVGIKRASSFFTPMKKLLLIFLFSFALGRDCQAQNIAPLTTSRLQKSAQVLRRISAMSRNGVPDAVLNNAKCLIVIPSAIRKERKVLGPGVLSCRKEDTWSVPSSVQFEGSDIQGRIADLLIFLMKEEAVQELRTGEFRIERQGADSAPLVKTTPVPKIELHAAVFTYEWGKASLFSSKAIGTILARPSAPHEDSNPSIGISSRRYISAVTSFVNTIVPTGIVLHHTAVIPGQEKPPRNERAIDRYHAERGFEILCSGRLYHVAYHYLVMANGTVRAGRPERCEGAHASGYNSYLGISVVGDFSSSDNPDGARGPQKPTKAQINSLVQLCRRLRRRYNIPLQNIVRHSDISNTQCPGDRFPYNAILDRLKHSVIAAD
jgi:N-acetylmuramoyl-L-alanine amidase